MFKTQAIVIPEAGRVELREVQLTSPGPDDVVVRTVYSSISAGTERMLLGGRLPHPMLKFPVVPGYETVGQVIERGANVPQDLVDRWVFVGGARCFGDVNPAWGGQAHTLIVDHRRVVPLDGMEPQQGVLLALGATALHGLDLLELNTGQRVLVLGQGPVGQFAARIARSQGRWVAVMDRHASRLERSVADEKWDVTDGPTPAELAPTTPPFDVIVEATGSMAALADALPLLKDNGTVLLLGFYDRLDLPYMPLFFKQARLQTAKEWAPGDVDRCRDLIRDGTLQVSALITHTLPIDQVQHGYEIALNDPECLKLVLEWNN